MNKKTFAYMMSFGIKSVLFRKKDPILGTVILTDKCNLSCKHCSVNNITGVIHPYSKVRDEMQTLYDMGIRILNPKEFETFFDASFDKMYGFEFWLAEKLGYLQKEKDGSYKMTHKGAFYYHYYEQYYTLAYIDKMWGIMKNEAFPEKIEL